MSQHPANAWLKWEWRIALITIVGGLIIGGAVVAYITFLMPSQQAIQAARLQQSKALLLHAEQLVCQQALTSAKNFGIVPNYAVLANALPNATNVTGRYTCVGKTSVAHYTMAVDLLCRALTKSQCVSLYSVSEDNGTILYQRRS